MSLVSTQHLHVALFNEYRLSTIKVSHLAHFVLSLSIVFSPDLSTVQGLFVQLTHLLCNKLVVIRSSRWKSDVHITLAAFELLSGLAQLSMNHLGLLLIVLFFKHFKKRQYFSFNKLLG